MVTIEKDIRSEMDVLVNVLPGRIKELAECYETPLPEKTRQAVELEKSVYGHLATKLVKALNIKQDMMQNLLIGRIRLI